MHREPVVDEKDIMRFLTTVSQIMVKGRDICWIMAGRADSNVAKITKMINHFGSESSDKKEKLTYSVIHMFYNAKQMDSFGLWKRKRGLANSKTYEQCFCMWKGKMPKQMPKLRKHVDAGTPLFWCHMRNVSVLSPRSHVLVSREVREQSLCTMTGIPDNEDKIEREREREREREESGRA